MSRFWVGIDVSKRKLDVAVLDERNKIKSRVVPNDVAGRALLLKWLTERGATPGNTHVCMESTGPYSEAAALAFWDASWKVSVVNPAQPKRYAESLLLRNKTDSTDASMLARYCAERTPELWVAPSFAHRKLRALVDRLQALNDMRQQELNRLEGQEDPADSAHKSIVGHVSWLEARIVELEKEIKDHIDDDENKDTLKKDVDLIVSIPGLGKATAAKLMAYLGDLRRFTSGKALAAFIGVTPQRVESGTSVRGQSKISRIGHAYVRQALFMPALVACRHNPVIKAFRDRMVAAGKPKKSAAIAAMHKLVHIIYAVVRSGEAFDPNYRNQPAGA